MSDRYMVLVGRTDSLKAMLENKVTPEQRMFLLQTMQIEGEAVDAMTFEDAQVAIGENIQIRRKYLGMDNVTLRLSALYAQRVKIHARFKPQEVNA